MELNNSIIIRRPPIDESRDDDDDDDNVDVDDNDNDDNDKNNDDDNDGDDKNKRHPALIPCSSVALVPAAEETTTMIATNNNTTTTANRISSFFEEQHDLVTEIMRFLDVRSLLHWCHTLQIVSSCLRYDHIIISSSLSCSSSSNTMDANNTNTTNDAWTTSTNDTEPQQTHASIIMNKLIQVFDLDNEKVKNITATTSRLVSSSSSSSSSSSLDCLKTTFKPNPLRVLRLVNGRTCEKCMGTLASPYVFGSSTIILPSLTLGLYCCTQCIFKTYHQ